MSIKETFVDKLMNRAFDFPTPEMPDFKCGDQDDSDSEICLSFSQIHSAGADGLL